MTTRDDPQGREDLNAPDVRQRLDALRACVGARRQAGHARATPGRDVNSHIHTTYSFSPYSPTRAVWMAAEAGLATAGIMDHDSIAGAREFIEAGRLVGLPTTIGAECRVSFADTPLGDLRINNPDQTGVAYVAMHGIPHSRIDAVQTFFEPVRQARDLRNRAMTRRMNALLDPAGIRIDYDADVVPLSMWADGGGITERHLLFAVARRMLERLGAGQPLVAFLRDTLRIPVDAKAEAWLMDGANPQIDYDLLGVLKRDLVEKFYIDAGEECPPVADVAAFARENGIVLAYAYLGDVQNSVTGDKKTQAFEDGYLDTLFGILRQTGFHAVTYMPSRNTRDQLVRVRAFCDRHGFFQISGEDINQPRQAFICEAMRDPFFANLYDAAWALIGHERLATDALDAGMFSTRTLAERPSLDARICYFREAAFDACLSERNG